MALAGVNNHAGGLVHDNQRLVFKHDVQRDVFRPGRFAGRFDQFQFDALAASQAVTGLCALAVNAHRIRVDGPPQVRAAVIRQTLGQEPIEPGAGISGADLQFHPRIGRFFSRHGRFANPAENAKLYLLAGGGESPAGGNSGVPSAPAPPEGADSLGPDSLGPEPNLLGSNRSAAGELGWPNFEGSKSGMPEEPAPGAVRAGWSNQL